MLKLLWVVSLNVLLVIALYGQVAYSGLVSDAITKEPLLGARIVVGADVADSLTVYSDSEGKFAVNTESMVLIIYYIGYAPYTLLLDTNQHNYRIEMVQGAGAIAPVIVRDIPVVTEPITTTRISRSDLQLTLPSDVSDALGRIPGVHMQSGGLNTNKISIRGIGARSQFSSSDVKLFYNDIPLHATSGDSAVEDYGFDAASRIELISGSTGVSHESGYGGAILLHNQNITYINGGRVKSNMTLGPWNHRTVINQLDINQAKKGEAHNISLYHTNVKDEGYRDNNAYNRNNLTLTYSYNHHGRLKINTLINRVDLKAFIPSSLDSLDYSDTPSAAAFTWERARGNEDYQRTLVGVDVDYEIDQKRLLSQTIYGHSYRGSELRPFNTIDDKANTYGVKGYLKYVRPQYNEVYHLGYRIQRESYDYSLYETEVDKKGSPITNGSEYRTMLEMYGALDAEISDLFSYHLGWNVQYQNQSTDRAGLGGRVILLPDANFTYKPDSRNRVYLKSGRGVRYFGSEEALRPDGSYATTLRPSTAYDVTLGAKGQGTDRLAYRAALYHMWVKDLLIPQRDINNQPINTNAGEAQYSGIEISGDYRLLGANIYASSHLNVMVDATLSSNIFGAFVVDGTDLDGNDIPGTPTTMGSISLVGTHYGLSLSARWRHVGAFALRDDGSDSSEAYNLAHVNISYQLSLGKWSIRPRVDLANALDTNYASMHLVNAASFGGNAPRYFYPGRPRHVQVGLEVGYVW